MSMYVDLAKKTVEAYISRGEILDIPHPLPDELAVPHGAFVSIHKNNGDLRGCIGTIAPTQPNLALEIIQNAISAATQDPRFPPIDKTELSQLEYSVDILHAPEIITSLEGHDPKKYGLIVEAGLRRGLLLPDLEGVASAREQFQICCQKGNINAGAPVKLYKFCVDRYCE